MLPLMRAVSTKWLFSQQALLFQRTEKAHSSRRNLSHRNPHCALVGVKPPPFDGCRREAYPGRRSNSVQKLDFSPIRMISFSSVQLFGINAKDPFRQNGRCLNQSSAGENQHLARRRVELRVVKDHPAIRLQDRLPDQWLAANKARTDLVFGHIVPPFGAPLDNPSHRKVRSVDTNMHDNY